MVVGGETVGQIGAGLLVYLGVGHADGEAEVDTMASKLATLRIFSDSEGKMSRSVEDAPAGEVLMVSQFTLYGDVRKGRRPSFTDAAPPERAEQLYRDVVDRLRSRGLRVATGRFRASMDVRSRVDGPVTILIDTQKNF